MLGYYVACMQKQHNQCSTYMNQICSPVYLDRNDAVKDVQRRMTPRCRTKYFINTPEDFGSIPNKEYFFQIQQVKIVHPEIIGENNG